MVIYTTKGTKIISTSN